jgi:hypothetical protein
MRHADAMAGGVAVRGLRAWSVRFGLPLAGVCLIAGGVLWRPLLAAEHLGHLERRSESWGWYVDQDGFLFAMVLVLVGLTALDRARVAGGRRVGRWAMHGLVFGWLLLVLGQAAMVWVSWSGADTMTGVGGLPTYPTVLVAGAAVVRSPALTRWAAVVAVGRGALSDDADPGSAADRRRGTWVAGGGRLAVVLGGGGRRCPPADPADSRAASAREQRDGSAQTARGRRMMR